MSEASQNKPLASEASAHVKSFRCPVQLVVAIGLAVLGWCTTPLVRAETTDGGSSEFIANASAGTASSPPTSIRPISNNAKAEARWRFDRGLHLYNLGDFESALVEFEKAYELTHHPIVLYNIGLVYARLGEPLESAKRLEPLLAAPEQLGAERYERARSTYEESRRQIGTLQVVTNVKDAIIKLDNENVDAAVGTPFSVTAGRHLVSISAPNYEPYRTQVMIAGLAQERVEAQLSPLEEALAHLQIATSIPDVDVFAGTEFLGTTPFSASLAFKPGVHQLRFQRKGYHAEQRTVSLHPGSSGTLDVRMTMDPRATASQGTLTLDIEESYAVVWVNGEPRRDFAQGMQLPVGRHHLKVQRAGFYDLEREVTVAATPSRLDIELFPTSEYMTRYVADANAERNWSWLAIGSGATVALLGTGFLIWNQSQIDAANRRFNEYADEVEASPGSVCDENCARELDARLSDLQRAEDRQIWGWAGIGVGAASIAGGLLMRALGDDPEKYEVEDSQRLFSGVNVQLGTRGVHISGTF